MNARMRNVKTKPNEENFLPEKRLIIDTEENPPKSDLNEKLKLQQEKEKNLFPMRIDERTVIYVSKERYNEEFKQKWMSVRGLSANTMGSAYVCDNEMKSKLNEIKKLLYDGYAIRDIPKKVGVGINRVRSIINYAGLHIPNSSERVLILYKKGMDIEEICEFAGFSQNTVKRVIGKRHENK